MKIIDWHVTVSEAEGVEMTEEQLAVVGQALEDIIEGLDDRIHAAVLALQSKGYKIEVETK